MLPSTNFVEITLPKSFRDNFRAVEYVSSLIMFLIAINIEVVLFSDIVKKTLCQNDFNTQPSKFFLGCHKNFSSFIIKPHFTKESLTVLALENPVAAVPNRPSIKTYIFIPFRLQNFSKHRMTLVNINRTEYRPKGETLKTKHLFFSPNSYEKPKDFL